MQVSDKVIWTKNFWHTKHILAIKKVEEGEGWIC